MATALTLIYVLTHQLKDTKSETCWEDFATQVINKDSCLKSIKLYISQINGNRTKVEKVNERL